MARVPHLGAFALAVLALAGCGGGDGAQVAAGEPIAFEQISQAAQESADVASGRFSFGIEADMPDVDEDFSFSGEGAFDLASKRASFSVDLSSLARVLGRFFAALGGNTEGVPDFDDPGGWKIDTIRDDKVTYFRFPAIADQLPAGTSWVRVEDGQTANAGGFELGEFEQFTEANPQELLELLESVAGEVETLGTETLKGVETTHYRASLDAASLEGSVPAEERDDFRAFTDELVARTGVGEIPVDVWLGGDGLVRRLRLDVAATESGASEPSRVVVTYELWDYGEDVDIDVPRAAEVVDASALD